MSLTKSDSLEKEIERLINLYGNDILKVSFMYLKDRYLAEDAFQEVFLRVFKNFNNFRNESSEKTWLFKITVNVCKDMLKTSWSRKVSTVDDEDLNNIFDEKYDSIEDIVDKKEFFQHILTLPDKYKDVIILYYYQGFDIKEIALMLNTTTGNVSSLLSRARAILKDNLQTEVIK